MKLKLHLIISAIFCAFSLNAAPVSAHKEANTAVKGSLFIDNWSATLQGGFISPLRGHSFLNSTRGLFGISSTKYLIPSFGLGFDALAAINTSSWFGNRSYLMVDHSYIGGHAALNMMNTFAGYNGSPRLFELELIAGAGWLHSYSPGKSNDANSWASRLGLNFNLNLGASKSWTLSLRPALMWNMGASSKFNAGNLNSYSSQFDSNEATFELLAGVTYHFPSSNGSNSFELVRLYNKDEVDSLNKQINDLYTQLENCSSKTSALKGRINRLSHEIDACNGRPQIVKEISDNLNNIRYIFFNSGSAYIQANQRPNLELIANDLRMNVRNILTIKGYASPEGSQDFNRKLSSRRAEIVKRTLVSEYNIPASQIETEGMGVGEIFNVSSWNRVAVCTISR